MRQAVILNYENLISKSIFCHFDPFSSDVRIERQKYAVIQQFRDKEIHMNPGKSTTASGKTSKGFTEEEKAAMKERAKELKAEERANKNRANSVGPVGFEPTTKRL